MRLYHCWISWENQFSWSFGYGVCSCFLTARACCWLRLLSPVASGCSLQDCSPTTQPSFYAYVWHCSIPCAESFLHFMPLLITWCFSLFRSLYEASYSSKKSTAPASLVSANLLRMHSTSASRSWILNHILHLENKQFKNNVTDYYVRAYAELAGPKLEFTFFVWKISISHSVIINRHIRGKIYIKKKKTPWRTHLLLKSRMENS